MKRKALCVMMLLFPVILMFGQQNDAEDLAILNKMMKLKMQGLIPMRFGNALDGKAIPGATIAINGIGNFITDSEGIITFPEQKNGSYTMVFSKNGFITTAITFEVTLSTVIHNRFSVSPVMINDYVRIVLDWGERPADLDLHFEKDGGYHISWRNMHSAADGSAQLDRDDRNGFGPETITAMKTETQSIYSIYIVDYTNFSNESSTALSRSGAVVRVYNKDKLLDTFTVPTEKAGNRWNVFRIVNGNISPVNTITYSR